MEKELKGKVAIVTGAGRLRGIGRAAAIALAKLGADVVVTGTGRSPESYPEDEKAIGWKDIESVADLVRAEGTKALPLVVDVTNEGHVKNMINQTIDKFGRIDILINNAAYARAEDRVPIVELDEKVFQKVVDIKLTGTFLCSKGVVEQMIKQGDGGKIVNISSTAGKKGSANFLAYNAGNFGVVGMTQSLARELGEHKINVNAVCPSQTLTDMLKDSMTDEQLDELAQNIPLKRIANIDEQVYPIMFLCCEEASYITGAVIDVNGGQL